MTQVTYTVTVRPEAHALDCELILERDSPGPLELTSPIWVPGAYALMKYGRDLVDIRITDVSNAAEVPWQRRGFQGISAASAPASVRVTWRAAASDPEWGELSGQVDHRHAVLRATRLLQSVDHAGPCRVRYVLPSGWALHHPSGARQIDDCTFVYTSFLELLECPVVCGAFETRTRTVRGVPFHHVFLDRAVGFEREIEGFLNALDKVAEEAAQIFGGFPFSHYTYIFTHSPSSHWGLEHPSSTMIALGESVYIDPTARNAGIRVCAHELFHAWNVCRMKPQALVEPRLDQAPTPDTLWIAEGFTRYFEFLLGVRVGELAPEQLFANVVNYQRHLRALPASGRVSALDASQATFLNHNRFPGSVNTAIDYYDAGMLIAFELDATLRLGDAGTLDQKMRSLYQTAMAQGGGYTQAQALALLAAGDTKSLRARVEQPLRTDFQTPLLQALGFSVETSSVPYLGLVLAQKNAGPGIADVLDTAPAARSGIAPGDVIQRADGFPFSLPALKWLIAHQPRVTLAVLRGHETLAFDLTVGTRPDITGLRWAGTDAQLERLRTWLGQPSLAWKPDQALSLAAYDNFHGVQTVI